MNETKNISYTRLVLTALFPGMLAFAGVIFLIIIFKPNPIFILGLAFLAFFVFIYFLRRTIFKFFQLSEN